MNTQIQVASCQFENCELPHSNRVVQLASVLVSAVSGGCVRVHIVLCPTSESTDSL